MKYNKRTDLGLISERSLLVNANILRRKNEQSDLNHSVGVQTTKTLEQNMSDKVNKINNCECHNVCGCCKENRWCTNEKDIKQPVGYYITFQSVPGSDHTVSVSRQFTIQYINSWSTLYTSKPPPPLPHQLFPSPQI